MAAMEKTRTPGIYKRGTRYVVVWRHRGKQHKSFHPTYEQAREAKAQRQGGDRRPASKAVLADYFEEWIESYAGRTARGFSETTRPEYSRPIKAHAIDEWGTWKLADVEPADVRALFGKLRKQGATTSAIKKLRAALSAMFATAVDDGLLRSNPVTGVRIPAGQEPAPEERAKALTRKELALLLAAIPEPSRLLFEFLAVTGLRISELTGLRWRNVELGEHAHVKVREQFYRGQRKALLKSDAGRRDIPLSAEMTGKLLAHRRDSYGGPDAPLFASKVGTPLIRGKLAGKVLNPARKAVGMPWASFHTFRHTCASLLFEEGRNVKQVADWLGHADPSFTLRTYVHLLDAGVGEGLLLGNALGNTTPGESRKPAKRAHA